MGNCQNLSVGSDPIRADKIKKNNSTNLTVKSYTWNRDSHGLFDYESKGIVKATLKVPEPGIILRDKDEVKVNSDYQIQEQSELKKLVRIDIRQLHYIVDSDYIGDEPLQIAGGEEGVGENCVWAVVKSLKTSKGVKGYELAVGDYLKLGRVRFRIKELQALSSDQNQEEEEQQKKKRNFYFGPNANILDLDEVTKQDKKEAKEDTSSNSDNACRICLGDNDDPDNPFITPCKCDGTMKCIHIKCLQQWLKSRLHPKETPFSISFVWKTFDCELCKEQFPNMVKVKGIVYDTVEIPSPEAPYLTLEILSKDKNICKGVHVIKLGQKNQIKLGRGHDSDIRVSDISVSRCHAMINYISGTFTVEDNNSKFGTLLLVKDPIVLSTENTNIAVQVGRTVLSFALKKNWKIYQAPIPPLQVRERVEEGNFGRKQKEEGIPEVDQISQKEKRTSETNREKEQVSSGKVVVIEAPQKKNEEIEEVMNEENAFEQAEERKENGSEQIELPAKNARDFQLPEFKDPAEELEAFQRLKEKESEQSNLQKQLHLLTQHRRLNLTHLENLPNTGEDSTKSDPERSMLIARIESYSVKIKEIDNRLAILTGQFISQVLEGLYTYIGMIVADDTL